MASRCAVFLTADKPHFTNTTPYTLEPVPAVRSASNLPKIRNISAGRESAVGNATRYGLRAPGMESREDEIFRARPDLPWCSPSLVCDGYRVFLGVKEADL